MSGMAGTLLTVLCKMSGSASGLYGTLLQSCQLGGQLVKSGRVLNRNVKQLSCVSVDMMKPWVQQCSIIQNRHMCTLLGSIMAKSGQPAGTRSYGPWASADFIPDLQRFLSEIGTDPKEARFWLKQFLNVDQHKPFAVVEVDAEVFTELKQLQELTSALSFLQRNSLRPIVVFSGVTAGVKHAQVTLQEVKSASVAAGCVLSELLEKNGVRAKVLYAGSNTLLAEQHRDGQTVKAVNPELIQWCMAQHAIPIIPALGETSTNQIKLLDTWDVTSAVSIMLQPLKIIKVNCTGGFKDAEQQVIANVNLPFHLQSSKDKTWCTPAALHTIAEVSALLNQVPDRTSVVITSADKVLQELFTHRGSGTFLKITEPIRTYHSLEGIDLERLTSLLTKSFKKTLSPTYFEDIRALVNTVYVSERYTGAAVILNLPDCDVPYLCKFAVSARAQGEGTGELLWDAIQTNFHQLFWRSRGSNPINQWYFKKSEGSWSDGKWTIFWYGIPEPTLSPALIKKAALAPESFCVPATGHQ